MPPRKNGKKKNGAGNGGPGKNKGEDAAKKESEKVSPVKP